MSSCNHDGKISIPCYGKPWCKYNGQVVEVTKNLRFDKILCMEMQLLPSHRIASHKLLQIIKISSQSVGRKSLFPSFCSRLPCIVSDYFKIEKKHVFALFSVSLWSYLICLINLTVPKPLNPAKFSWIFQNLSILSKFFRFCSNSLDPVKIPWVLSKRISRWDLLAKFRFRKKTFLIQKNPNSVFLL